LQRFDSGRNALRTPIISYAEAWMPAHQRWLIKAMETVSGRGRLITRYRQFQRASTSVFGVDLWDIALDHLGARGPSTAQFVIPKRRPGQGLLLVANHPFGVADGVTLAWIASRIDPDFKVIANGVLCREPALNGNILPIEFQPSRAASKLNVETRRQAIATLKAGGVVALFPAGSVSWSPGKGLPVRDDLWKPLVGRLVRSAAPDVLPIHFSGSNSPLFQHASRTAMTFRLGLYLYEIRKRLDCPIDFNVNDVIPFETIPELPEQALANWLRDQVIP
jgi:putative hemolysin